MEGPGDGEVVGGEREGAGDGAIVGARVGETVEGAIVAGSVEHSRLNTTMPPSPPGCAMDTKSLAELVFVDCAIAAITPLKLEAPVLTLTVVGECRCPVSVSL